ncbi:acyl-CoA desaturase [Aggregicoccus sp. 17bor-14]|uniref:acyl-CoA desaturase n=1 Tax=Myxococcaceae TaxID=31 RepID=UPI00129CB9D9|nr:MULTISPECIES: fatty acid desaturase [Myxococcaceae]MBF5042391.1 fatty acid desaturase [Simulacricoccus sp. 17bor-14]MRI88163.1 acyl-CoA desaturase [Aggregicoccus sp. 17bor-14]
MDSAVSAPAAAQTGRAPDEKINWLASIPFIGVHLMCLFVLQVGARPRDVAVCLGLYVLRMWGITAGFHRYFSHRSFKTGRVFQFILAFVGTLSTQKGVLWWAAHHRHHHRYSDAEQDIHSPVQKGFWWSHAGWILCDKYGATKHDSIKDFGRFPELRLLNRFHLVPPVALAVALYFIGGFSMLVWGFFVSTTLLWHGTFTINSLSHVFGKRRYKTTDTSRNNWLLALITLGEGWHNNHHYHQNTANQGWFWWEVDLSYYSLKVLSWFGVVKDLRVPSESVKYAHLRYTPEQRAALDASTSYWSWGKKNAQAAGERVREAFHTAKDAAKDAAQAASEKLPAPAPALERT